VLEGISGSMKTIIAVLLFAVCLQAESKNEAALREKLAEAQRSAAAEKDARKKSEAARVATDAALALAVQDRARLAESLAKLGAASAAAAKATADAAAAAAYKESQAESQANQASSRAAVDAKGSASKILAAQHQQQAKTAALAASLAEVAQAAASAQAAAAAKANDTAAVVTDTSRQLLDAQAAQRIRDEALRKEVRESRFSILQMLVTGSPAIITALGGCLALLWVNRRTGKVDAKADDAKALGEANERTNAAQLAEIAALKSTVGLLQNQVGALLQQVADLETRIVAMAASHVPVA
jgi:hypothetical protein